jgi:hypothetical protein
MAPGRASARGCWPEPSEPTSCLVGKNYYGEFLELYISNAQLRIRYTGQPVFLDFSQSLIILLR